MPTSHPQFAARSVLVRAAAVVPLFALLVVAGSCSSDRTVSPTALTPLGGTANSEEAFERPTPETIPDLSEEHGSHFDLAALKVAFGKPGFGQGFITGFTQFGGHFQTAIQSIARPGMPSDGSSYLVVSSGDARNLTADASYSGCVGDAEFGTLCDVGGVRVMVAVPANANTLSFDLVYFSNDYTPYEDPVRVFLQVGGTTTRIAQVHIATELGSVSCCALRFGPRRTIAVNAVPLRGQTVTLTFQASDRFDNGFASGAMLDNLRFDVPENAPPTVTLSAPATGDEGSAVTVTANVADPNGDAVKVEWDFNGDGVADFTDNNVATPGSPSHSWTYADNGTATVKVTVTDPAGATATATATITINNVAPTITSFTVPSDPTNITNAVAVSATFTDPGTQDTHTASFDWGDGSSSAGVVTELNGSGSVTGSHVYASAGLYCITVTVTDKDGGVDSQTSECVVVFDPDAGFTTGGGYINTSDGKVNYGFNAKYQGMTPEGNTNIQLAAGHFKATSYDWLVVSGNRAQFAGTGTIDGSGSYSFMITIIDDGEGGDSGDRIRIKVWNSGGVVFDTQLGAPDTAAPTTAPGGGNLQVHSKD